MYIWGYRHEERVLFGRMNSKSKGGMTNGEGTWNSYTGRSLDGVFLGHCE
jgi:hypothetical protein